MTKVERIISIELTKLDCRIGLNVAQYVKLVFDDNLDGACKFQGDTFIFSRYSLDDEDAIVKAVRHLYAHYLAHKIFGQSENGHGVLFQACYQMLDGVE